MRPYLYLRRWWRPDALAWHSIGVSSTGGAAAKRSAGVSLTTLG